MYAAIKESNTNIQKTENFLNKLSPPILSIYQNIRYLQDLWERGKSQAKYQQLLLSLKYSSQEIYTKVNNYKYYSLAKREKPIRVTEKDTDITKCFIQLFEYFEQQAIHMGLFFKVIYGRSLQQSLHIDQAKVSTVLWLLIENALKNTKSGGIIIKIEWFQFLQQPESPRNLFKEIMLTSDRKDFVESIDGIYIYIYIYKLENSAGIGEVIENYMFLNQGVCSPKQKGQLYKKKNPKKRNSSEDFVRNIKNQLLKSTREDYGGASFVSLKLYNI